MINITDRDKEIKYFLRAVIVADTNTISILFFNGSIRSTQQRLKLLVDNKYIKVFRENILSQNIYYINKKPSSWKHKIIFSRLLSKLKESNLEVLKYVTPLKIGNVIADGFIAINNNGKNEIYFVEVELTKYFDLKKYEDLYYSRKWKDKFPIMPNILVISDKKVKTNEKLNISSCKLDLSDLMMTS